ncbi:hypothetical protein LTR10_012744 [Elasticomyces elasticus]|uniref:Uncharacterized protein n=1 Tax=Exophiala sideris TaxID=1016849 RepID=A0ABR0JR33_9EURO|nr:hypothetical protein LTR10_012744 [Elasticomyces elasticus]KAK5034621.1 hypothetical protein LTR13_006277 [Exophiala sideris]KAK5040057.1 hypothetical protein LTS07_000553 [Exophiala sideris]KAK5068435.1 hypothetical protein LTR69_000554 [Exophiala sideris]KAK5187737.1 hypothetical protein LTR44_000554 [Eurotiomycetes sp. CCFEE 6388]
MATGTAASNQIPANFARLGLNPKSPFAAISQSSVDEPGDPQPGIEVPGTAAHSPFAAIAPSASDAPGDPTPRGGTLPSRPAAGGPPGGNGGVSK